MAPSVVLDTSNLPVTNVSGVARRPSSLNNVFVNNKNTSTGGGSPVTSPPSGSGITILRPVSAPFLPHQPPSTTSQTITPREACPEQCSSPRNNEVHTNNDDKGKCSLIDRN